ncbi:TolC family protein [Sphingosinithalassobacter sp. CS137]|uniref:TolC family protein n=1 Tax=Sphingosinithalassobacter sp. CS137 TaxID=2762748 RepID=UPI0021CFE97A|nr:TolC family protein [Sphingosinithalassobacter sp. CS137]
MPLAAMIAAQAAQAQPVGYEEALEAARAEQPVLEAGALRVEARRVAADAADELPDPRLRAGVMNLPVTGPAAFEIDRQLPTQIAVGIEQEIPNLARRRARSGLAASEIRLAEARLGMTERSVLADAGGAWVSLYYAQRRMDLARTALADLREFVPVANSAVASGSARPAESLAIRRELLGIEDAITAIEASRETAQARLSRYIVVDQPVAQGIAPSADVDPERLRLGLETNPELLLADAESERSEAGVRLARSEKRPDFGVSVTYGRRNPDFGDVVSVMGSVTLPIFTDRRQNPRIAAAEADAAAALAERDDRLRAVTARFEADLAAWRSAVRQWERARDELIPLARNRATLETASFAAGRADLVDVIAAKSALALLELEILEREQAAVEAAATLRLTYGEDRP